MLMALRNVVSVEKSTGLLPERVAKRQKRSNTRLSTSDPTVTGHLLTSRHLDDRGGGQLHGHIRLLSFKLSEHFLLGKRVFEGALSMFVGWKNDCH